MKTASVLTFVFAVSTALLHAQAVPALISYQGKVVDGTGVGLGTGTPLNRKILFRLFDAGTGGNRLWSEEQTVTLSNGDFSVILGQGIGASYNGSPENPRPSLLTVFAGTDRYLEIIVDNGDGTFTPTDSPITPRQRLISTAFAVRASVADGIASGSDFSLKDANYGLGWYGTGRPFNGLSLDGPVLYGASGGALGSVNGSTQNMALRWTNDGKIGIGTASPTEKLDIVGNAKVSGTVTAASLSSGGSVSANGSSGFVFNTVGDTDGGLFSPADGVVTLKTNGNERLRVDSNGNLAIGMTTAVHKLDVNGSIRASGGVAAPTTTETGGTGTRVSLYPGTATEPPFAFGIDASTLWSSVPAGAVFKWYSGITERMNLNGGNGNLTIAGGLRLPGSGAIDSTFIGDAGDFLSFGQVGVSEDFIGYKSNVFYFRDSPGGGDIIQPSIDVGNNISAGGTVSAPTISATGNVTAGGTVSATTVSTATVNATGNVSAGGTVTATGNVTANGKTTVVGEEVLRMVRGTVEANGTRRVGAGFTSSAINNIYTITFATPFSAEPSITTASVTGQNGYAIVTLFEVTSSGFKVSGLLSDNHQASNVAFSFIAAGPR